MAAKKSNRSTQKLQYRLSEGNIIEVKKSLPKGYEIMEGTLTQPLGTRWARKKGEPLFKVDKTGKGIGRNPQYKTCLVVVDEDIFTSRIAADRVYKPDEAKNFITDVATEKKIAVKEKWERKKRQEREEIDRKNIAQAAKARREETKKKTAKAEKPVTQRNQKSRSTNVAKVQSEAAARKTGAKVQSRQAAPKKSAPAVPKTAPAAAKSSQSFAVKAGRTTRTFASKAEAKVYAKQCKNRNVTVTPSTRKPTHKIVSFTAKK